MQGTPNTPSVTLSAADANHIAALLERVATHEDERAHGKVNYPLIVMRELSLEAHHWARYLQGQLAAMHPANGSSTRLRTPPG